MLLNSVYCENCGTRLDPALQECPSCGHGQASEANRGFRFFYPLGIKKELTLFLIGYLGLSIIAGIIQMIMVAVITAQLVGTVPEQNLEQAVLDALTTAQNLAIIQYLAYGLTVAIMCLTVWKDWKQISRKSQFKSLWIAGGTVLLTLGFAFLYNAILIAAGAPTDSNANQSAVEGLTRYSPALAFIFMGLLGPMVEELSYRVGLFGFLKRIHPAVAYGVAALVFALIHFDFTNIGSAIEWINLPSYIVPGLLLCLAYDYGGLSASYLAHAVYNCIAIGMIFI